MANTELAGLSEDTSPAATDLVYTADSTGTTDAKVQVQNLVSEGHVVAALDGATLTAVTVADDDKLVLQDTSAADAIKTGTASGVVSEGRVVAALDGATIAAVTVADGDKLLLQDVDDTDNLKVGTASGVVSEGRVVAALDNATLTDVTVADDDEILLLDTSAASALRSGTAAAVVSEGRVIGALDGATLTNVAPASTDRVLLQDADDSFALKYATVSAIAAGGAATPALDNLASVAINESLISDTDVTDDLGSLAIRWNGVFAAQLNTGDTAADTLLIQAYDVDGAAFTTFITLTANNTPTCDLDAAVTLGGSAIQTAISGASLTAVTVAADDKVLVQDTSDSDNLKTVTTQAIADLGGGLTADLGTFSGSGSASIDCAEGAEDWTLYHTIEFIVHAQPDTDGAILYMRVDVGAGFISTGTPYGYALRVQGWSGSPGGLLSTGANQIVLDNQVGTASGEGRATKVTMHDPGKDHADGNQFFSIKTEYMTNGGAFVTLYGGALWAGTTRVVGVQFIASTGNVTGNVYARGLL